MFCCVEKCGLYPHVRWQCFYMLFGALVRVESNVGERSARPLDVGVDAVGFIIRLLLAEVLLGLLKATNQTDQKLCPKLET